MARFSLLQPDAARTWKNAVTGEVSGRRQRCTAACGGLEVQCLLMFYHRDTRVFGKAKELVTKKFVLA